MPFFSKLPPLSLYVHIPWCVRKCPYCDFNSHEAKQSLPEELYVRALLQELDSYLPLIQERKLISIFFGGGTPSLFSANAIGEILTNVAKRLDFANDIEITLEANPGTIDQVRFRDFYAAGINRLSIGIQSLQDDKLKTLGRIHDSENAKRAIDSAQTAGFTNFNLDIMYGLPDQSLDDAMQDIAAALAFQPTHFSWYQLTIEPNTFFYHQTPTLPPEDNIWEMQQQGQQLIASSGFQQYEVSAYAKPNRQCVHNLNYWQFGDYLGIGAGAHSKMTLAKNHEVCRFSQVKNPRDYLDVIKRQSVQRQVVNEKDLMFEFMLNALRLTDGVPRDLFCERTGMPIEGILPQLAKAKERGLLIDDAKIIGASELGKRFLNDLVAMFLSS
jgi:oxygen-independent coproporphyrinogen-3 oxidase